MLELPSFSRLLRARPRLRSLASLLLLLPTAACSSAKSESPTEFRPSPARSVRPDNVTLRSESRKFVEVAAVGDDSTAPLVRSPGRVAFRDGAVSRVGAPVNGRVVSVFVHAGQHVQRGERLLLLASQDAATMQADLTRAEVGERAADAEVKRQRAMKASGVAIESDLLAAQAHLDEARAELARARSSTAMLGRARSGEVEVRAPIEGDVLSLHASPGSMGRPDGDALLELGNARDLWLVTEVFERELPMIKEGATASAELASASAPLKLHVVGVGAAVDPQTRRAPVYLAFDALEPTIVAGMYARVSMSANASGSVGVPASAVLVKDGGKTIVYVASGDASFTPREVSIGRAIDGRVPVFSGLQVGERIAVRGALLLDSAAEQLL